VGSTSGSASGPTALIVGAGVGGLAAAIALRKAGWHVRVFERAAAPRELGFALNLAPNAIAALRELGVAAPLLAQGARPERAEMRGAGGRVLRRLSVSTLGREVETVVALRTLLHGTLLEAVGHDALCLANEAVDFHVVDGHVHLRLAGGKAADGDLLVGADGVGSVIRRRLHPDESDPRRSGYWAVRGVAHRADHHLGNLSGAIYFAPGIEAGTVRAGGTAVYWYLSLLADDVPEGATARELADRAGAALDEGFRRITRDTATADLRLDELFDRDPIDAWGHGPVTLLGDAAHPMLPHTGQGAAQALEDAVALGLVLSPGAVIEPALRRYEGVRSARTRAIVTLGRRIAGTTTTRSPLIAGLRTLAIRAVPSRAIMSVFYPGGTDDPHRALRPGT